MRKLLAITMMVGALSTGAAMAQTGAPAAAPAAPAKQVAAPAKKAQAPRTAESIACSKEADAQKLTGKPRKAFRAKCLKAAKAKAKATTKS
jgi:hypothetical protein